MKINKLFLLLILSAPLFFNSCVKDKCEREITYVKTTTVFKTYDEIRSGISMEAPRDLVKPGKIYYYNNHLFINEQREGVHVFDNSFPENPVNLGFLKIPGNIDISIREGVLYADNYTDLLAISLSDISNPAILKRVEDVFPPLYIATEGIAVYYEYEEVTEVVDCNTEERRFSDDLFSGGFESTAADQSGNSGQGGSLARFTIYDDYLYTIDNSDLHVFDINQIENPSEVNRVSVGWEIETIFSYTDKLFIGSTTGMIVMDAADPANPTYLSQYSHFYGCDPVFVKAPYAYVTLRSGNNFCADNGNQLDLVNISDLNAIYLEKSFAMDNPHGLSIKDNTLFICEGDAGLKTFDIETPLDLNKNQLAHIKNIHAFDVISLPGSDDLLLLIGEDGFYQYNAQDPTNLRLLSHIPVFK
ncbi:MAG: hypothetical protein ACI8P3_003269 [Saprospiraceae bacterium]|jgi:hypothetical protein